MAKKKTTKKASSIKKSVPISGVKTIMDMVKYPFNKLSRLFNFYWILLPIFGWLAVAGYAVKIIQSMLNNDFSELPAFGGFAKNMKKGFFLLIYMIPIFIVLGLLNFIPFVGQIIVILLSIFLIPILFIQYCKNEKFMEGYQIKPAVNIVFNNIWDYILTILKNIVAFLVLAVASILIITMIVTIPAMAFNKHFLMVDFYNRNSK